MIRVGIAGYGNLGRGVEAALGQCPDLSLAAIFSRRPGDIAPAASATPVYHLDAAPDHRDEIDVLVLCGGSASDLPEQTPALARHFCVVDSFDTHAAIPQHFARVDQAARAGGRTALISCGWDPGFFSLLRTYTQAVLPQGTDYTFWGPGVSQGHSDALRRLPGVLDARQYTLPVPAVVDAVRAGERPVLTTREKHTRLCYVVPRPGCDRDALAASIRAMPCYFADYDTEVVFVTEEALLRDHGGLPHGGFVLRTGDTGDGAAHTMELRLTLGSNPAFTGAVLAACARAAWRLFQRGEVGCLTMLDLSPALLSSQTPEELRRTVL